MKANTKAMVISGGLALLAVVLVYFYVQQQSGPSLETNEVYVMSQDVAELVTLDETMVRKVAIPKKFIQPGALADLNLLIGSISRAPIKKDEQVLFTKLYLRGQ